VGKVMPGGFATPDRAARSAGAGSRAAALEWGGHPAVTQWRGFARDS